LTENDVIEIIHNYLKSNYPSECKNCGKQFDSLADYLRNTTHIGLPVSYDAIKGNWKLVKQIGTISMADCPCGTTLSVSSKNMDLKTMRKLMLWAKKETRKQDKKLTYLLGELRAKVDAKVFSEEES
jgi:hypothetical protein